MRTLKKSPRRCIFSAYTTASPLFGALIALVGLIVTLAVNPLAGALMLALGIVLFVVSANVWVFDKDAGSAARGLYWRNFYRPFSQRPLDEIDAIELTGAPDRKDAGTPMDDSRTALLFKNGERRSLWSAHSDRSRDLAKFLNIKLVEPKAVE